MQLDLVHLPKCRLVNHNRFLAAHSFTVSGITEDTTLEITNVGRAMGMELCTIKLGLNELIKPMAYILQTSIDTSMHVWSICNKIGLD